MARSLRQSSCLELLLQQRHHLPPQQLVQLQHLPPCLRSRQDTATRKRSSTVSKPYSPAPKSPLPLQSLENERLTLSPTPRANTPNRSRQPHRRLPIHRHFLLRHRPLRHRLQGVLYHGRFPRLPGLRFHPRRSRHGICHHPGPPDPSRWRFVYCTWVAADGCHVLAGYEREGRLRWSCRTCDWRDSWPAFYYGRR